MGNKNVKKGLIGNFFGCKKDNKDSCCGGLQVEELLDKKKEGVPMDIKVLGTGCANCNKLEALVKEVVKELNVEATIEKVTDINEISKTGVLMTPGLLVDGAVKVSGKLPSKGEMVKIIQGSIK